MTHRDLFSSEGLSGMEASEGSMLTSEVMMEAAGAQLVSSGHLVQTTHNPGRLAVARGVKLG